MIEVPEELVGYGNGPEKSDEGTTFGDYLKTAASGALSGVAAPLAAGVRAAGENIDNEGGRFVADMGKLLQGYLNDNSDAIDASRSEGARKRAEAAVTSEEFWKHPISSAALKLTNMTPAMAAMVFSGGTIGAALVGGALSSGSYLNEVDKSLAAASDDELRHNAWYRNLRELGMDEASAREDLKRQLTDAKVAGNFAAGVVGGALGPAGKMAAGVSGKAAVGMAGAETGILGRTAAGMAEGAAGGGLQGGVADATLQQTQINAGTRNDFDEGALVTAVLDPAAIGGVAGAAAGALFGGKAKPKKGKDDGVAAAPETQVAAEQGRGAAEAALEPAPVSAQEEVSASAPAAAPVPKGPEVAARIKNKGKKDNGIEVVKAGEPNAAETLAIADMQQPPAAEAKPVTPEVTPAKPVADPVAGAEPVPEKVAAAAKDPELQVQKPVTPEVTPEPAPVTAGAEPAPVAAPVADVAPISPKPVSPPEKTGRILRSETAEAKANAEAQRAQQEADLKAANAEAKTAGEKKRGEAEKASLAQRATHAEELYNKRDTARRELPVKREERAAMAADLGKILEEAAARGLTPREDQPQHVKDFFNPPRAKKGAPKLARTVKEITPEEHHAYHLSVPTKVGNDGLSPHVRWLREVMDVKKALEAQAYGPASKNRARVADFIAEHGDLEAMAERRKVQGDAEKRKDQGDVEAPTGKTAEAVAGAEHVNEDTMSPEERLAKKQEADEHGDQTINDDVEQDEKTTRANEAKGIVIEKAKATTSKREERKKAMAVDAIAEIKRKAAEQKAAKEAEAKAKSDEAKTGQPITIDAFHGTTEVFDKFDNKFKGSNYVSDLGAHWFTASSEAANSYAVRMEQSQNDWKAGKTPEPKGTPNVHMVKLDLENPFVVDMAGKRYEPVAWNKELNKAREAGHDGVVMKNAVDGGGVVTTVYAVFDHNSVRGRFSEKPNKSKPKLSQEELDRINAQFKKAAAKNTKGDAYEPTNAGDQAKKEVKPKEETDDDNEVVVRKVKKGEEARTSPLNRTKIFGSVTVKTETGREIKPIETHAAKDILAKLDLSHLSGVPKGIAEMLKRRLAAAIGDIPVHLVSKEDMAHYTGDMDTAFARSSEEGVAGVHTQWGSGLQHILLRADYADDPKLAAHTAIHEIAHALTQRALNENAQLFNTVKRLMRETSIFRDENASLDEMKATGYGMMNPHEFMAEAFSNPKFQEFLASMPVSKELAKELGLATTHRASVWDALINKIREIVFGTTRVPSDHLMIEAVMRVGAKLQHHSDKVRHIEETTGKPVKIKYHDLPEDIWTDARAELLPPPHLSNALRRQTIEEAGERAKDAFTNTRGWITNTADKLSSAFMLKERAEKFFGPDKPMNEAFDLRAKQERAKERILTEDGGAEIVKRAAELERANPEAFAKGADLLADASLHNVNLGPGADNSHHGKDAAKGWQAKKVLPELQRRFTELAREAPEVAKYLQDAVKFTRDVHDKVSMELIKNVLEAAGIRETGLAERIFKDGLTEADRTNFDKTIVSALNKATNLKELKGWYLPFRRYGEFISSGTHELAVPANATRINDNTLQFREKTNVGSRRAVKKYVEQAAHTPEGNQLVASKIEKVYVDRNDPTKRVDSSDINGVVAYRISMQTQHTEFHSTLAEAQRNQAALTASGLKNTTTHKREEAHRSSPGLDPALSTVMRSLEHNDSYKNMNAEQRQALKNALLNASIAGMKSTNIKTSMAHRRNVAGMSRDVTRVLADYAHMTANYRAQLQFRPKIDAAFEKMRQYMKGRSTDKDAIRREELFNEMKNRIYGDASAAAAREPNPVIRKLLQVSRLSRLAGVSFHVINSQEPWTTSLPMIGGRHGFVQAARAMGNIYAAIGARGGLMAGLKDTVAAYRNDTGFTDYVKMFKDNIAKSNTMGGAKSQRFMEMLDYMNDRNLFGNDTVYEVGKYATPDGGRISRGLDRADLMANQVGSAIEAINRTVTGLTAYELEYKRNGGNHEAAMHYAYTIAHETMGDYSSWNAAPVFNTRGGQLALQFKKFAHKTYYMLGETIGRAAQGDKEAIKQFAGLMVTHGLVAGVLGMPTEPMKVALMAANATGAIGFTPEDYDNAVRHLAARVAGAKGGEIISRGLYRGIGVEVSGRMGLDSLLTYGQPKSYKDNDLKAWLFSTMAGAPAGFILDQLAAAQALSKGDLGTAVAKASPVRAVGDVAKAVTGAMGPKLSPTGREQHAAFTPYQTAVRAAGFTPAAVAEDGAMRGDYANSSKKVSAHRSELINTWINATGAKKVAAQRAVQQWNASNPKEAAITQKDLSGAANRRENEEPSKNGIKVDKHSKSLYDQSVATFNSNFAR